jgi:branched-chain amino acid transport system ATP-binding protein
VAQEPLLALSGVKKSFGQVRAANDCTIHVGGGEVHALIGPNGAGKTTLVALITGEIAPDAGIIRFAGEDITRLPIQDRVRRGLARSFQISSIFREWTALENVMIAVQARETDGLRWNAPRAAAGTSAQAALAERAMAHLSRVGLAERARMTVGDLSHGEVRQLEVAMSLALTPKLILLDEPMAGLGRTESKQMTELLAALRSEASMLLIEHDVDVVFALADRITVLAQGSVVVSGPPEEIKGSEAAVDAYLGRRRDAGRT